MEHIPAHVVHGFNVWDGGKATTGKLCPYLQEAGFDTHELRYGWRGLLGVRLFNKQTSRELTARSLEKPGGIAVGHSNGCAIIHDALWRGARFDGVVLINPALDTTLEFPPSPELRFIHVWHSPSDAPVKWAKLLWFHPWGSMGAYGYKGRDRRVTNFNKETDWPGHNSCAHSDVFHDRRLLNFFGPLIASTAKESMSLAPTILCK